MDKFEARKILKNLDTVQEFLNNKDLPQLQSQLIAEVDTLKKEGFNDWISSVPDSVKEILYNKVSSDQLYSTFFQVYFIALILKMKLS